LLLAWIILVGLDSGKVERLVEEKLVVPVIAFFGDRVVADGDKEYIRRPINYF
jgi:hypothetical protein